MKIFFLRMTYGGNSSTFSRERQLLIPKQENFSINCCTELFTQIRFFIKWVWYRHLCVPFVEKTEESLDHLFIYCDTSKYFWSLVTEWLDEVGFDVRYLSTFDITFMTSEDSLLLNHVIILSKYIINQSRSLNIKPTLTLLKAKKRSTYQTESLIAKNNDDTKIHKKKWQKLLPFVDSY